MKTKMLLLCLLIIIISRSVFSQQPLELGDAVVTRSAFSVNDRCVEIFHVGTTSSAPLGDNWGLPIVNPLVVALPGASWTPNNLGQVFGIAINTTDADHTIYVSNTQIYPHSAVVYPATGTFPYPDGTFPVGMANFPDQSNPGTCLIYALSPTTGVITPLVKSTFIEALPGTSPPGVTTNEIFNRGTGLGNICYDPINNQIFATNFEDGRIYRIDVDPSHTSTYGHVLSRFDPFKQYVLPIGDPNDPSYDNPEFVDLGDRLWGIGFSNNTLYFARWREDLGHTFNLDPLGFEIRNEIWSVAIDPMTGDFAGLADPDGGGPDWRTTNIGGGINGAGVGLTRQFTIDPVGSAPTSDPKPYSNPIADIEFSTDGCLMLLAERTMSSYTYASGTHQGLEIPVPGPVTSNSTISSNWAHRARVIKYELSGTNWNHTLNYFVGNVSVTYPVANHINTNSAGGTDLGYQFVDSDPNTPDICEKFVWVTGDALKYEPFDPGPAYIDEYVYGITGIPVAGNSQFLVPPISSSVNASSYFQDVFNPLTASDDVYNKDKVGDVDIFRGPCSTCCNLTLLPSILQPLCYGENSGSITIAVDNGTEPYNFQWSANASPVPNSGVRNGLFADTYSVTVTDGAGCSATITFDLPEPEPLVVDLGDVPVICVTNGEYTNVLFTANVSGGTPDYSYSWSTGESSSSITVTPTGGNNYSVTVTDENGCTAQDNTAAIVYNLTITALEDVTICEGESVILTVDANSGGWPFLNYSWSTGEASESITVSPTTTTTYSVSVSMIGCEVEDDVTVIVSDTPCDTCDFDVFLSVADSSHCANDSVYLTITSSLPGQIIFGQFVVNGIRDNSYYVFQVGVPLPFDISMPPLNFGLNTVCFIALDGLDSNSTCRDTSCVEFYIDTCESPSYPCDSLNLQANFTWERTINNNEYEFTNHSSILSPYTITSFDWDFNGTMFTTLNSNPRTETLSGSPPYIICLTANYIDPSTGLCCKDTYCDTITPGYCDTIGLKVTIEDTDPVHNDLTVDLEATIGFTDVLHQFPFLVDKVIWDYGDNVGSDMGINPPSYTYGLPGNYQAVVTVIFHLPGEPDLCCILTDSLWICAGHEAELQIRCMNSRPQALAGKDAMIAFSSNDPNIAFTNYGSYECMMADAANTGIMFRSLIEFDLSEIENLVSLEEATLTLYNSSCASPNSGNSFVTLRRITSPWEENSVTWENQPSTTRENEIMLSSAILKSEGPSVINIKPLLADLLNEPGKNYGLMLLSGDETAFNGVSFGSSDNFDASVHPMLDVCYLKEETVSGVTAMDNTESLRVYPNPSEGVFKVELENIKGTQRDLQVLDVDGKVVLHNLNPSDFETVDLSKFSSGIYLIKVTSDRQHFLTKIVKL